MTPVKLSKTLMIVPFALAIALVGCGDSDGTVSIPYGDDPLPTPDTVPPGVPTNLQLNEAEGDVILVQWDPNSETDLAGYVLQRSVDLGETWVNVSSVMLADAMFSDTLRDRADYRVSAIDTADNQSAYTANETWVVGNSGGGGKVPSTPDTP